MDVRSIPWYQYFYRLSVIELSSTHEVAILRKVWFQSPCDFHHLRGADEIDEFILFHILRFLVRIPVLAQNALVYLCFLYIPWLCLSWTRSVSALETLELPGDAYTSMHIRPCICVLQQPNADGKKPAPSVIGWYPPKASIVDFTILKDPKRSFDVRVEWSMRNHHEWGLGVWMPGVRNPKEPWRTGSNGTANYPTHKWIEK